MIEHRDLPPARAPGHARGWPMFLGRLAEAVAAGRPVTVPPEPCDPGPPAER